MQASPTSAGCEEEGKVVCRGGHIRGQPGTLIIHFPTSALLSLLAVAGIRVQGLPGCAHALLHCSAIVFASLICMSHLFMQLLLAIHQCNIELQP